MPKLAHTGGNLRQVYLSGRSLALGSGWLMLATFGALWPVILPVIALMGVAVIVALVLDRGSLAPIRGLTADAQGPPQIELNRAGELTITFSHREGRKVELQGVVIECRLPVELRSDTPPILSPACATIRVTAERLGVARVGQLRMRMGSRGGFWLCEQVISFPQVIIRVTPSMAAMPDAEYHTLCAHHPLLFQGVHHLSRHASPDLYLTSRGYQHGDPLRMIDHRKSARYGALFTKEFETQHEHHLVVALDMGRSMAGTVGGSRKSEHYRSAAANLLRVAAHMGDSVSFLAFADSVVLSLPRARSLSHFSVVSTSPQLVVRDVASDFMGLEGVLSRRAPQRAIVVIFTDAALPSVQDQLAVAVPRIARKHLALVVSMHDTELDPEHAVIRAGMSNSSYSLSGDEYLKLLYRYWVNDAMRGVSHTLSRAGAELVVIPEGYWLDTSARIYRQLRRSLGI